MLIIDGYNLMFHPAWDPEGNTLEEQRRHLIARLGEYRHLFALKKLAAVFDARSWSGPYNSFLYQHGGIYVIYSSLPGGADEKIILMCQGHSRTTVVTADRKLANRVKKRHAAVIPPDEFIRDWERQEALGRKEKEKIELPSQSQTDVEEWLDAFGLEAEIEIPPQKPPPKRP